MDWFCFWMIFFIGIGFVELQGFLSYADGYFTRKQMLRRHGIRKGNSFLQHGGMWCDTFVITPLVAYVVSKEHLAYLSPISAIGLVGGMIFWAIAATYFVSLPLPEAHAHDGRTTWVGVIHWGFAVIATWILTLFYFSHPPMRDLIIASTLLTPFFFLGIYKFDREWKWNPVAVWMTVGGPAAVWSVVLWRWFFA